MRILDLCSGIGCGMLAAVVNGHQPVAAVEREPYCCQILRDRRDEGWFPGLTVHECDLRDFDPSDYAGRVDCVSAGWPCQGISRAGNRQGFDDERSGLWSEVFRILRVVRPRYAFLENGPDILDLGAERVLCDLASLGMDARWCRLSAGNTGASHERERWWCLAHRVPVGLEGKLRGGGSVGGSWRRLWPTPCRADGTNMSRRNLSVGTGGTTMRVACEIHLGVEMKPDGGAPDETVLPTPEFVEWLMHLPGGWSRPASLSLETDRMCSVLLRPGRCSGGQ